MASVLAIRPTSSRPRAASTPHVWGNCCFGRARTISCNSRRRAASLADKGYLPGKGWGNSFTLQDDWVTHTCDFFVPKPWTKLLHVAALWMHMRPLTPTMMLEHHCTEHRDYWQRNEAPHLNPLNCLFFAVDTCICFQPFSRIQSQELVPVIAQEKIKAALPELQAIFTSLDADGSGFVTQAEAANVPLTESCLHYELDFFFPVAHAYYYMFVVSWPFCFFVFIQSWSSLSSQYFFLMLSIRKVWGSCAAQGFST